MNAVYCSRWLDGDRGRAWEAVISQLSEEERRAIYDGLKKIGLAAKVAVPTQKDDRESPQDASA